MPPTTSAASSPLYFEDLSVGQRFVSRSNTITAEEIKAYATVYDPQPFHLDEVAAMSSIFGGLVASGWQTAAISMQLIVDALPLAGGVIGAGGEIQWPRPTRPGDTLQVEIEFLELMISRSRPDRGSAIVRNITRNQNGEPVQTFMVKVPLLRRSPSPSDGSSG